jgi:hypothetical protein
VPPVKLLLMTLSCEMDLRVGGKYRLVFGFGQDASNTMEISGTASMKCHLARSALALAVVACSPPASPSSVSATDAPRAPAPTPLDSPPRAASATVSVAPPSPASAASSDGVLCRLPQYGAAAPGLVVTFGLDGPVWGVREITLSEDGEATYGGNLGHPAPGTRFPKAECEGKLTAGDVGELRRALAAADVCHWSEGGTHGAAEAWTATLCVSLDGPPCMAHLPSSTWKRDPRAKAALATIEALARRTCERMKK